MPSPQPAPARTASEVAPDVDVLIVGAGITGIYQLYRALEAGFSAQLSEAGSGVGGTWFWNRYPGARFDSESYTYGYIFSRQLFEEWPWQEHFAEQPEIERYLNHVVDRFELRRHIRFDARVTGAVWDEPSRAWVVTTEDRTDQIETRARFVVAATGVLSVPFFPDVPGREDFAGESYHTGLWPKEPVDLDGKRVAVIGTGSSGVQIIPVIAERVASLTVYQRTANWCTPLNNALITDEQQAELVAGFDTMADELNRSIHGFLHPASDRKVFDDDLQQRRAFFEKMWASPGFAKLNSNYVDVLFDPAANAEWCEFIIEKIRATVKDPATAEALIPKDHRFGEKRPPFVTGYYETYNRENVSLVDLTETPILHVTPAGIETADGLRELDVIIWATGFDFGTGALSRMGIRGRRGLPLVEHWADGPTTFLGVATTQFPNLLFPGGPHAAAGNNPRYNGDQVDFVTDVLVDARRRGQDRIEVDPISEKRWTAMIDRGAAASPFGESSYFFGSNIPGKPRKYLLNSGGRPKLFSVIAEVADHGYEELQYVPVDRDEPSED